MFFYSKAYTLGKLNCVPRQALSAYELFIRQNTRSYEPLDLNDDSDLGSKGRS